MKEARYQRFMDFIAPGADRFSLLMRTLEELGLKPKTVNLAPCRHIFVSPDQAPASPGKKPTVLSAHYDRVEGSPGANDNSAAVFQLIETAVKLKEGGLEDWLIIFTDKEELREGEGIQEQGSYKLAGALRNIGLGKARIFTFDACGCGDTLVISSTADRMLTPGGGRNHQSLKEAVKLLRDHALEAADRLRMHRVLLAPVPFSDDAGFLSAGMAAQTITMLPSVEAVQFASRLRTLPALADAVVKREVRDSLLRTEIPETWRYINGPGDSHLRLTWEFFPLVVRFAKALCE